MATITQALAVAGQYRRAGHALEAEQIYWQIVRAAPDVVEARVALAEICNDRGAALAGQGRLDEAIANYRQALELRPGWGDALSNMGVAFQDLGRLDEAVASLRQAVASRPDFAEAYNNLGVVLQAQGKAAEALASYEQAIRLKPEYAHAYNNSGIVLQQLKRIEEAMRHYRQAVRLLPDYAEAYHNLATALSDLGKLDEAEATCRQALRIKPDHVSALTNLGAILSRQGKHDEAIAAIQQGIRINPADASAHGNLGVVFRKQGKFAEAAASFQQSVRFDPRNADAHNNLANVLVDLVATRPVGHERAALMEQAYLAYDRALALQPHDAQIHWNKALGVLVWGDFERGWPEFEWRLRNERLGLRRDFAQPRWDGSALGGRTILLYTEGGFGDALHFVRYVPMVVQRGGRVILECQPELKALLQTAPGPTQVVARGETLPHFDVQNTLTSLPLIFGTRLETIPAPIPYLTADAERAAFWEERLAAEGQGLRVGLVWAGRSKYMEPHHPSSSLEKFRPLAKVHGVKFYSLQKGDAARQAQQPPAGLNLIDWTTDLHDFADTAALVSRLDLVISIDTSMVHLAGALGKPVWALLALLPDFRWLLDRTDSPWYPTVRLFRQKAVDDWDGLLERVAEELRKRVAGAET